ncbi:MAG: (2Fe-2S)-binding protein [Pirellulales bacterium]|nr:(2Fe-2S)-binding protein [Pirellulales bacterium]MEE2676407.1 (2Fe-2S)-binding protein [Planctomycetota bacterium]|tara:strand:+ start:735 stop:1007 length:273 start_codon:yes stop_codon:yes gene_type:complete
MQPDDELCLCFHITKRKVTNYIRVEKPRRASQISECFGAGTGCGWCRPFLQRLFDQADQSGDTASELPDREEYSSMRKKYMDDKKQQRNS